MLKDSITSYSVNFTPDGRMVGKDKTVAEKNDDKGGANITAMIKFLVQPIVDNIK